MSGIGLNEFGICLDVQDEYREFRTTYSVMETLAHLKESFGECFDDDEETYSFWIGIAKVQTRRKEVLPVVAENALEVLERLNAEYQLRKSEIALLRKKLQDPSLRISEAEAKKTPISKKAHRKFQCTWKRGDVYAFQLKSEEAKKLGLDQKWILLRKVAEKANYPYEGGRIIPVVHFMLWEEKNLPEDDADLELASWFRTHSVTSRRNGRMCYRYLLDLTSKKSVETYGMIYLGNFSGTGTPEDEISTERAGLTPSVTLAQLDQVLCSNFLHFGVAQYPYLQPFDRPVPELQTPSFYPVYPEKHESR